MPMGAAAAAGRCRLAPGSSHWEHGGLGCLPVQVLPLAWRGVSCAYRLLGGRVGEQCCWMGLLQTDLSAGVLALGC